jgi:single-strand DNA-binding protein
MSDANYSLMSGRFTKKPVLRETPSGVSVVEFTLANNLRRRASAERTTYLKCTAWNNVAKFVATLDKGDLVIVEGQLVDDNYEDKNNDNKMTRGRMKLDNCRVNLVRRKTQAAQVDQAEVPDIAIGETVTTSQDAPAEA